MGPPARIRRSEYVISSDFPSESYITTMDTVNYMRRNQKILLNMHQGLCIHINCATLQTSVSLQIRLDSSDENCPEQVSSEITKKPCCQLHWWSTGRKKLGNACSYCKTCHVISCDY